MASRAAGRALPDADTLVRHVLALAGSPDGGGAVVERQPGAESTHHAEIVTLGWPDGRSLRLVLKYGGSEDQYEDGQATGVAYEALVYDQVLARLDVTVPRCYGSWYDPGTRTTVLVLQFAEGVSPQRALGQVEGMARAAAWIGRLHALAEPSVAAGGLPALTVYDASFYRIWARRTREFERRTRAIGAWLGAFLDRIDAVSELLCGVPQTLIHGDCYPDNMVCHDGVITTFDWEQAARAPGEIDLASLTLGWHDEVVRAAEDAYRRARWPDGPPPAFARTLEAARALVLLRLLGEAEGWPDRSTRRWRVDLLRQSGERLGLL